MNIIGISAFYHESSCCLLQDGRLIAAASEERFSRRKHDPELPISAFRYCLQEGNLHPGQIDCLAYYENPITKLSRQLWQGLHQQEPAILDRLDPGFPEREIRSRLAYAGPIRMFQHHESHAASAFYYSGFQDAAILTADGVGEWDTTTYGYGEGDHFTIFERVEFPHSLGLLYAALTSYLGFQANDGEYKVMGLAAFGTPRFRDHCRQLVVNQPGGGFRLRQEFFDFSGQGPMITRRLIELFGREPRRDGEPLDRFHQDVAASLQSALEEIILQKAIWLAEKTGSNNLCMAGGVALNAVANGKIRRKGPFDNLFIQPAAGDSGACLGAAALAHLALTGSRPTLSRPEDPDASPRPLRHVNLGPDISKESVARLITNLGVQAEDFTGRMDLLSSRAAEQIANRKIIAWCRGRMEFGPRALGYRSILANPLDPDAGQRLNRLVKKREDFRPFAPSVLADKAVDHFELQTETLFMIETCAVRSPLHVPAITHIDGSARPQTVRPEDHPDYAALLGAFLERTGCPILLNTSFNVQGQPIVCTAADALLTFALIGLDALVLGDYFILKEDLPKAWLDSLRDVRLIPNHPIPPERLGRGHLYTFI